MLSMTLKADPSKAEEIQAIREFCEELPGNSYLKSLLKGVPEYCERRILDDNASGLVETIDYYMTRANDLEHGPAAARKDERIMELENALEASKRDIETKELALQDSWQECQKLRAELNAAACNTHNLRVSLVSQIDRLNQQIIEFKAKLYDLMTAEPT